MIQIALILAALFTAALFSGRGFGASDPLALAAEYYFARQDYKQALDLWNTVLRRQPDSFTAVSRVAELRLLFQGRAPAREAIVAFLNGAPRLPETRRLAEEKLGQLQAAFLTDEGQSAFYQALPRIQRGECEAAIPLLGRAVSLEKGNARVLREKSRCELTLGLLDKSYATLQQAFDLNPFAQDAIEGLAEAHLYFHVPAKVVELFRTAGASPRSSRQRVAYGVALVETGAMEEAVAVLQPLLVQEKAQRTPHPIVSWALGNALASTPKTRAESLGYLDAFFSATTRPESTRLDGWDPYRTPERIEAARKMVAGLRGG